MRVEYRDIAAIVGQATFHREVIEVYLYLNVDLGDGSGASARRG